MSKLDCDKKDEICVLREADKYSKDPRYKKYLQACLKYKNDCGASDDACYMSFLTYEMFDRWEDCFNTSCDEVPQCLESALNEIAPGCSFH